MVAPFLGDESDTAVIELTHNWETSEYEYGNAFGHIAFAANDIYALCERIRTGGGIISREPGPMKHGNTVIAFVRDPDGWTKPLSRRKTKPSSSHSSFDPVEE